MTWLRDIVAYLSDYVTFPQFNLSQLDLPSDPLLLTDDDIELAATDLREAWNLRRGPIANLVLLLENHGVIVALVHLGAQDLEGKSGRPESDRAFVFIGTDRGTPARWRFEADFLRSTWTCIWGRGCQGILDHPAEDLQQGCCSVGAEMGDAEEAMTVSATAAAIRTNIKVLVGACIFLNRPGSAACWVRQDDRRHGRQDPARSVPPPPASMAPLNNPAQV